MFASSFKWVPLIWTNSPHNSKTSVPNLFRFEKACSPTHCVLLKHYYSVDFPWWFDRKISFFSLLSKTCEMAECKATLCDLTEKLFVSNFIRWPNLQIILEVKSMDESSWKKNSIISVFILVFAGQVLFTVNGLNW